jgi:transmembrane sensor
MDNSPKYEIPWDLITESLTDSLSVEGKIQLQQWISSNPDHKEKYLQIQELWKNKMEDYALYKIANEKEAWKALRIKAENKNPEQVKFKDLQVKFSSSPKFVRNFIAIAAVFLGLIGIGFWFMQTQNNPVIYETAANVQKKITLTDGSTITLSPFTKIEIPHDYNKVNRTIIMASGEANFDVEHRMDKPFTVEMGTTQIKDIGTNFTILKGEKTINVIVTHGVVSFMKLATKESRKLEANTSVTFNVKEESFGEIKSVGSSGTYEQLLNFENTPLSDAIVAIQNVYRKKIILSDKQIATKKITAQLDGMPYRTVMEVICKSLGLEYSLNDSVYLLKEKKQRTP